jgi:hypothetical protein
MTFTHIIKCLFITLVISQRLFITLIINKDFMYNTAYAA